MDERDKKIDITKSDLTDKSLVVIQNASLIVPLLGSVLSNIFGGIATGRKLKRINEVLINFASDIRQLNLNSSKYIESEDFEEILESTLLRISRERSQAKRTLYKNYLVSAVNLEATFEDYKKKQYFETLDQLHPLDIIFLKAILQDTVPEELKDITQASYLGTLKIRTENKYNDEEINDVVKKLNELGITNLPHINGLIVAEHARNLKRKIHKFGHEFLKFIQLS